MATKQVYAAKDFKYGTRMMRAGDAVEMTAPQLRLYRALGAVTDARPRSPAKAPAETQEVAASEAPAPAPRKRTAKRKTAAKK